MKKETLKNFPFELPFFLDGATGTELLKRGMKSGESTERFVLENPDVLVDLQKEYLLSGSNMVLAPTFGANEPNLLRHGFEKHEIDEVCKKLLSISKNNFKDALIGGDLSSTGLTLAPFGDTTPQELFSVYKRQAEILIQNGVDFFFFETMISAHETYLGVKAIRSVSKDIPVFVCHTVTESGKTTSGDDLGAVLLSMLPLGINAFGCNCSFGPQVVANALKSVAPLAKLYNIPLIAKPNAGMPETNENGETYFPLTPEDMADSVDELIGLGVGIFGGCCGTTSKHIKAICERAKSTNKVRFSDVTTAKIGTYVSSLRYYSLIDENAEYIKIDKDSEDQIYDLIYSVEPQDTLYFELGEGAADLLLSMDAFIKNPYAVKGEIKEIEIIENTLCRKIR